MICKWCDELIEEPVHPSVAGTGMHRECAYRSACGSVAHLMRRCSCCVPGSVEGDPEGVTKRQAAMEAWEFGILLNAVLKAREAN
jgi:hypothetical protein